MSISELKLIKRCAEFRPRSEIYEVPRGTRGIYTLLKRRSRTEAYDVVYIGMARGDRSGVGGRLRSHARSKRKGELWTHFSVFEVWDNITESEIAELEGLFRHIYRRDKAANVINRQRGFRKLRHVRQNSFKKWGHICSTCGSVTTDARRSSSRGRISRK